MAGFIPTDLELSSDHERERERERERHASTSGRVNRGPV